MARKPVLTAQDRIRVVLRDMTQKQAAKALGIGERTIRRILANPDHKTTDRVAQRLQSSYTSAAKRARQQAQRAAKGMQPVPRVSAVPPAARSVRRVYKQGVWTGEHVQADWVYYMLNQVHGSHVKPLTDEDTVFRMLQQFRDAGMVVRAVYLAAVSDDAVKDGDESRITHQSDGYSFLRLGTGFENLAGMSDADLYEFQQKFLTQNDPEGQINYPVPSIPLYLAVLDPMKPKQAAGVKKPQTKSKRKTTKRKKK